MIRFDIAWSSALVACLIAAPVATGQEPAKGEPTSKEGVEEGQSQVVIEFVDATNSPDDKPVGEPAKPEPPKGTAAKALFRTRTYTVQNPASRAKVNPTRTVVRAVDALEANFGLRLAEADGALRAQLGLPPEQGIVVVALKPDCLAAHAGVKLSDVFVRLGDQKATSVPAVRKALLGLRKEAVEVELIREGKAARLSLVGPDHGQTAEVVQYWIGVPVSPVDATLRTHLPSLAAEVGLVVNDVVKESPAEAAGVQKNDILVSLGGTSLKTSEQMVEQIQASGGKPVSLEILRAGKPLTLKITPEQRTHAVSFQVEVDPFKNFYQYYAPRLGVETTPAGSTAEVRSLDGKNPPRYYYDTFNPIELQMRLQGVQGKAETSTAKIEAQLADLSGKVEEIRKLLEGIKKPESK